MNNVIHNSGFMNNGTATFGQVAAGTGATITNTYPGSSRVEPKQRRRRIGVVTIKAVEMRAVIDTFGLTRVPQARGGQEFYAGSVEAADGPAELVATRTLQQGQRSTIPTLETLRREYEPVLMVLVGIGGAISRELRIGDVVIANRVVYYDERRETEEGMRHRGEERHAPAAISHAANSFFTDAGEPARLRSSAGQFRVLPGPIGSGEAVIMNARSGIRRFLSDFNEKILAIETEAGGLTQFCHEAPAPQPGWLVVRGISDDASPKKTDEPQVAAALNAAVTLQHLIPYLRAMS